MRNVMLDLIEFRKQLLSGTLTQDQAREAKRRLTRKIDWGNRYCSTFVFSFKKNTLMLEYSGPKV